MVPHPALPHTVDDQCDYSIPVNFCCEELMWVIGLGRCIERKCDKTRRRAEADGPEKIILLSILRMD